MLETAASTVEFCKNKSQNKKWRSHINMNAITTQISKVAKISISNHTTNQQIEN